MSARIWRLGSLSVQVRRRVLLVNLLLLVLLGLFGLLGLLSGRLTFTPAQLLELLLAPQQGGVPGRILLHIRLPRVLTALCAGAALGVSGAIFQSLSRNPLGSPDIIGFTTGAASGAIAYLVFVGQQPLGLLLATLAAGLATALLVYLLARRDGQVDSYRLVLIGIGIGSTMAAVNGLLLIKGSLDNAMQANLWLAGSLNARSWMHALPVLGGGLLLIPLVLLGARQLTLLEMGDDLAAQLGVRIERVRGAMTLAGVLLAALATAAVGPLAFIALAAPQLVLRLGRGQGVPVCGAALMGACLLLAADQLAQRMPGALILPIGRMTALLGGLYLLWLLTRQRSPEKT
ncbi:MAG: Fe(3+)-siderophore ABC transporter permease [Pseudomonas sp.]|nr:Fe(3+)-siderophore ABC transporter permease [Pseudomonas sp.]